MAICPLCQTAIEGEQRFLICTTCYLSPTHLVAKTYDLLRLMGISVSKRPYLVKAGS